MSKNYLELKNHYLMKSTQELFDHCALSKIIVLNESNRNSYPDFSYQYENETYYFKVAKGMLLFFNELLGSLLCQKINLEAIQYKLAGLKINSDTKAIPGLASQSFEKAGLIYEPPTCTSSLEEFIKYANTLNGDDHLIDSLTKLFAIDIYSCQTDRYYWNILLEKSEDITKLAPVFDFEESFQNLFLDYRCCFFTLNYVEDLKYYIKVMPNLQTYLNKLFGLNINDLLEEIEDMYKIIIPSGLKKYYETFTNRSVKTLSKSL